MIDLKEQKIAIVYDWIDKWGGVERVLLTFAEIFPAADFYTSYVDREEATWANNISFHTSFIQRLPSFIKKSRVLSIPLYPYAFESFNFSIYDLVISVSSSFAKGIITKPGTLHISYILTPMRYVWVEEKEYLDTILKKGSGKYYRPRLARWDLMAAARPDYFVSISKTVKERVRKHYQRSSNVIYPPFDTSYWNQIKSQIRNKSRINPKYYLVVSRLEPYKRVDLVIDAFNKLGEHLIIVGKGSLKKKLEKKARSNITFLSDLKDEELAKHYQNAHALIMPQEEEFGYVALEAQFFGCPVIAYKKGGAQETIQDGKTGIFFLTQSEKALRSAVERFKKISYNLRNIALQEGIKNVEQFSRQSFEKEFKNFVTSKSNR